MFIKQARFVDRVNFGYFLNDEGLKGQAVEIGTHRGSFAATLLNRWNGAVLHCVDHWDSYDPEQESKLPDKGSSREVDMCITEDRLRRHGSRVNILRATSLDASLTFDNLTLDFVYIDGDHRYPCVYSDLQLWYPKLRKGGILAGHDIINSEWNGVQAAVLDFVRLENIDLYLVVETKHLPWSYFMVKE